jgi:hypothetical protein
MGSAQDPYRMSLKLEWDEYKIYSYSLQITPDGSMVGTGRLTLNQLTNMIFDNILITGETFGDRNGYEYI